MAQDATAVNRRVVIEPSLSATTSFVEVQGRASDLNGSDWVSQVGSGLRVSSRSGRVQGLFDYALLADAHLRRSERNRITHSLFSDLKAEAVPGWAYVDARATVTQQSISAFGQQTAAGSLTGNDNSQDVLNLSVSPYVKGELAGWADYEFRLTAAATNVRASVLGDSSNIGSSLSLQSPRRGTKVGWGFQANQQRVDFRAGRATDSYRVAASLRYAAEADLVLVARLGQESTNVGGLERRSYDNWGAGVTWTPTARTTLSASGDRRYFGNGYQLLLDHRFRRSQIRFASVRDATSGGDGTGVGTPTTLFQLYMRQFQSSQPDPALRETQVRDLLRLSNQDPNTLVGGGFASAAIALQRRDDLAYSYLGRRTTMTLQAFSSTTSVLDTIAGVASGQTRQAGVLGSLAHRLTPTSSLSLAGSYQRTLSNDVLAGNSLKTASLGLTTLVDSKTSASLIARTSQFSGLPNPNRETALTASLSFRF